MALVDYSSDLALYEEGRMSESCLSYSAYYHCLRNVPRCYLNEDQPVCEFVCRERARRCGQNPNDCESVWSRCSGSKPRVARLEWNALSTAGVVVAAWRLWQGNLWKSADQVSE